MTQGIGYKELFMSANFSYNESDINDDVLIAKIDKWLNKHGYKISASDYRDFNFICEAVSRYPTDKKLFFSMISRHFGQYHGKYNAFAYNHWGYWK